jgi:hypothetical protein
MPKAKPAGPWLLAASLAAAQSASAQSPQAPAPEPKTTSPATNMSGAQGQQVPQLPARGRNQFSSPVMSIQIQGEGVALPGSVAQPEPPPQPAPVREAQPPTAK